MKLRNLKIQNFRGIQHMTIDFTNDFGEANDVMLIVGPNGSGKTSILDAIWLGLMGEFSYSIQRETFRTEFEFVVHERGKFAKVDYSIEISEEERIQLNKWKDELAENNEINHNHNINPDERIAEISWTYPPQIGYIDKSVHSGYGGYKHENKYDWSLLQGRYYYSKLKKKGHVEGRKLAGGIYFFEQERRILSNRVHQISADELDDSDDINYDKELNIRKLLVNFGVKDKVGNFDPSDSWYKKIQAAYNYICSPHKMGEVYTTESAGEYKIDFKDGDGISYGFDGLSSGERSILNFLVHYVYKRMYNAIVLIDELELHLHPTWQRRLIDSLRNFDDGNQFIITTHSPILQQSVLSENVYQLGQLDAPNWQSQTMLATEDDV